MGVAVIGVIHGNQLFFAIVPYNDLVKLVDRNEQVFIREPTYFYAMMGMMPMAGEDFPCECMPDVHSFIKATD